MAIDTIKSSAITDGTIATGDLADDAVTGTKLANDINIAGDLTVTGNDINTAGSMLLRPAGTEIVNINNTGDVIVKGQGSNRGMLTLRAGSNTANSQLRFGDQASDTTGRIMYDHSDDTMRFQTNGSERVRISAAGLAIGGTGAANTLDDYEEGTWTPDLRNADNANSFTLEEGYYTKVGNRVFAQFRCDYGNTGGGGGIQIRNLPFAYNGNFSCVGIVAVNGGSMSGNNKQYAVFATSGTTFQIYNGGSISSETYTFLSGSIHYLTNS